MADLSEEEIATLREKIFPNADEIARDAEYQKARNVVWKHWKSLTIGFAAFVVAIAALFVNFKALGTWLIR